MEKRIIIQKVADMLEISPGSVKSFLKGDLKMGQVAANFVPCLLREEQNVNICEDIQERIKTDPYLF